MLIRIFAFSLLSWLCVSAESAWPASSRETHRIRISNRKGGAIEFSLDGGRNWQTVGRVTRPATDTGAGFAALTAATPGAVAAVSLDGITVRTDQPRSAKTESKTQNPKSGGPRIFNLLPVGGVGGAYSILTDLPRGRALFGSLASPLGAAVLLESASGSTRPLPGGYIPQADDRLLIVATVPAEAPAMLVIENREGGSILAVSPSGDESEIGQVRRPLRGVARYPATDGAAGGGVVAHHPAAVVVATTPSGGGEAGGFLIQPAAGYPPGARHERREGRTGALKPEEGSVLVVDRLAAGPAPFGLPIALSPVGGSLVGETRVETRLDGGPWEPLPGVGGAQPTALTAEALAAHFAGLGVPRTFSNGITHLRLVLAPPSPERLRTALGQAAAEGAARLASASASATRRADDSQGTATQLLPRTIAQTPSEQPSKSTSKKLPRNPGAHGGSAAEGRSPRRPVAAPTVSRGGSRPTPAPLQNPKGARKATKTLRVVANIQGQGIAYVLFYVDGKIRKMTNTPPFEWVWDTRGTPNGPHTLEIRGADEQGRILTTQTRKVEIYN